MAFGLAVYASPRGLPRFDARLASSRWSDATGRAFHPQGSNERFQRTSLHLILLPQALLGAITSTDASISFPQEIPAHRNRNRAIFCFPARTMSPSATRTFALGTGAILFRAASWPRASRTGQSETSPPLPSSPSSGGPVLPSGSRGGVRSPVCPARRAACPAAVLQPAISKN